MKFKVLAAFSVVLIIFGVASLGAVLQDLSQDMREDTYLGSVMAVWFLAGGALLYWAARKRYSAGWRMYLGAFLLFFGFVGASIEADSIVNMRAEEPVFGFVLACGFAVSGLLLARSGYRRNVKAAGRRQEQPAGSAASWSGMNSPAQTGGLNADEVAVASGAAIEK